jgi:1-acyl-sn-glycerol-3-phosphate acyltransferase
LYRVCRDILVGVSSVLFRLQVVHRDRVPAQGAYVIAPSHRSNLDTPFVAAVTRRRIRFMGKKELWKYGWSARLFNALGAFPVDRAAADRTALRTAMAAVEGGEPLVIFPEGTRRKGPLIEDLHDGAAYVAARTGVPILPVGIGGSEDILAKGRKWPRFRKVVIVVGDPIPAPPRDGAVRRTVVAGLTDELEKVLQALYDDAQARATRSA